MPRRQTTSRGFTLIELMAAMAILLIGLLGLLRLHFYAVSSNGGARMQTNAAEIARELATGLERLPFDDTRLSNTGSTGTAAPTPFGYLLDGTTGDVASGAHAWDDGQVVAGVRTSGQLPPGFERRWTVWGYSPSAGGASTVKIVAVSVIWTERGLGQRRELVQYTQLFNPTTLFTNLSAIE